MGDAFDKSDGDAGTMVTIMPRVDQTENLLCLTLHQPVPAVWQAPCLHVRLTSRSSRRTYSCITGRALGRNA